MALDAERAQSLQYQSVVCNLEGEAEASLAPNALGSATGDYIALSLSFHSPLRLLPGECPSRTMFPSLKLV